MKRFLLFIIQFTTFIFCLSSVVACVSVNLGRSEITRSKVATFAQPNPEFKKFDAPVVDHAWRHPKDGNSISVISQCEEGSGFSLEEIKAATIAEVESAKVIEEKDFELNERAAKSLTLSGAMDGVASQLKVVSFRKHDCIYSLTYVAKPATFKKHLASFDEFVKGYKVP